MDLNHIQLPGTLVTELYRSVLVEFPGGSTPGAGKETIIETNDTPENWKFLGGNGKQVLVVVNNEEAVHIPDEELPVLTKMLAACKLSMADVAIINMKNYPGRSQKEITAHFNSRVVLLFGTDPVSFGLPMNFPAYQVQPFAGVTYLFSPAIAAISTDTSAKASLWQGLKRMFAI